VGADNGDLTHPNANGNRKYANNWFIAMVNQGLCPAASVLYNIALDKPINALPSTDQPTDLGSLFWIVNGGINDGLYWQRIAATADQTLEIDLQGNYSVSYFELNHFGSSVLASVDVSNAANTSTYQIQLSANHDTWTTIAAMTNNSLGRTVHIINPTPARYVRLIFNAPFYLNTIALREFRVLGIPITVP